MQKQAFEAIGIDDAEAEARFGFLLEALRYGAPPHGGIAYGLDRFVQRVLDAASIRDVIAFPKAASGADPLTGAPAPVDPTQLRDLGLQVKPGSSGQVPSDRSEILRRATLTRPGGTPWTISK